MSREWCVGTGRPSWHQARAGHGYSAITHGFTTKEQAEEYAARCRDLRPHEPAIVFEREVQS